MRRVVLILIVLALLPGVAAAQSPVAAFLMVSGGTLTYRGQPVLLRGENDPNLVALGAHIGSGKLADLLADQTDYSVLQAMGANHLRLGLSLSWYQADRDAFFTALDQQVAWAKAAHQWLLPALYTTPGDCYEGYGNRCALWASQSEQDQLTAFWSDFAAHYAAEPTIVGYDLLNEPNPPTAEQWLTLAERLCNAIAAVDGNHFSVVESIGDPVFPRLLNCPRVVYSVHIYAPGAFTTGGQGTYPGLLSEWDGNLHAYDAATLAGNGGDRFTNFRARYSLAWAAHNNVPMYVGEYGCLASASGCTAWVNDVTVVLKAAGVSFAHYALRHDASTWGIFQMTGPLTRPGNQGLYDVMRLAFAGSVQPNSPTTTTPLPGSGLTLTGANR